MLTLATKTDKYMHDFELLYTTTVHEGFEYLFRFDIKNFKKLLQSLDSSTYYYKSYILHSISYGIQNLIRTGYITYGYAAYNSIFLYCKTKNIGKDPMKFASMLATKMAVSFFSNESKEIVLIPTVVTLPSKDMLVKYLSWIQSQKYDMSMYKVCQDVLKKEGKSNSQIEKIMSNSSLDDRFNLLMHKGILSIDIPQHIKNGSLTCYVANFKTVDNIKDGSQHTRLNKDILSDYNLPCKTKFEHMIESLTEHGYIVKMLTKRGYVVK